MWKFARLVAKLFRLYRIDQQALKSEALPSHSLSAFKNFCFIFMASVTLPALSRTVTLRDGSVMPVIGLGVYEAEDTYKACMSALALGYRHIDTAQFYRNEAEVGRAVRESKIPRDKIFVTTKVWIDSFDKAGESVLASAKRLNIGVIDLVLLHAPVEQKRLGAYQSLEKLVEQGVCRSIGVSNFGVHHLEELLENCKIPPVVNQIELHPFFFRKGIVDFCSANGIVVQAYSPLAKGERVNDKTIKKISNEIGKTPAQVLLRWALTKVPVILPKSSKESRQAENAALEFDFTAEQLKVLDSLSAADGSCTWDPTTWK